MKTIENLLHMKERDRFWWLLENQVAYELISTRELLDIVEQRDYWEEKATKLAEYVGDLLKVSVGEHSNINCPIQNAIDAIFLGGEIKCLKCKT